MKLNGREREQAIKAFARKMGYSPHAVLTTTTLRQRAYDEMIIKLSKTKGASQ